MNISDYINNAIRQQRADRLRTSDQMTLGKLIAAIEPIAANTEARLKEGYDEARVAFDFEYLHPTGIDSWRGSYSELALSFQDHGEEPTVSEFLAMLKGTVGKTFEGYKGGEFIMDENTPIWVANYGNSGNTAVVGVLDEGWKVILLTGYREY